jgi:hypothetical protein
MIKESLNERKRYDDAIAKILEAMEKNPVMRQKIKESLMMFT